VKIKELMTPEAVSVAPETSLKEVAAILAERGISGLPVVDDAGKVLGVVSEADILVKEQGPEPRHGGLVGWLLEGGLADTGKLEARTAGEAMTSPAVTIGAERRVAEAARMMTEQRIKRLPVVDAGGALVGIVTRADLVKAFARPDETIEREIRDDVLRSMLWIDDDKLELGVERGEVTLSGRLERRSDAELLPRFVARVPGVVDVRSTLTWGWDDREATEQSDPRVPIPPRRT
jgi:CBS domain-containing protein